MYYLLPVNFIDFMPIFSEIWLVVGAVLLLMLGAFKGNKYATSLMLLAIVVFVGAAYIIYVSPADNFSLFNGMFVNNSFTAFVKLLILIGAGLAMLMSVGYFKHDEQAQRIEFPVLVVLSVVGMFVMVSAGDLISMYMGLELQSLALYVLAAMDSRSVKSSESGLKYFILGAIASSLLLFGCSYIYGFTGTVVFSQIATQLTMQGTEMITSIGVLIGLVLVLIGFFFKVSAVPFHMWTPDVYEGAPTPVTAFFAVAPKVAAFALLARVVLEPFGDFIASWQQIVIVISAASMVVGALGALRQSNIKRLMAYSSIGHMGYALMGLAAAKQGGVQAILIYLALYMVMSVGAFACIMMMQKRKVGKSAAEFTENITDLSGISTRHPLRAFALAVIMFSMAGIPPLAGFWGKLFIFQSAIQAEFYVLAVIGVLSSVIAAYYYLRIVKVMYFDPSAAEFTPKLPVEIAFVSFVATLVNLAFFVYPTPLFNWAKHAAAALLG